MESSIQLHLTNTCAAKKINHPKIIFMESGKIFSTDLLDIIFENRNKDYGAYQLRKGYDDRLRLSFLIMTAFALVVCALSFLNHKTMGTVLVPPLIMDHTILPPPAEELKKIIPKKNNLNIRSSSAAHPPVITNQPFIKPMDTNPQNMDIKGIPDGTDIPNIAATSIKVDSSSGKIETPLVKEKESVKPLMEAEVMPEFPGGINALIKYLQNNLKSPEELDENDTREVRIRFVVDINGSLSGLDIIKSGGQNFDHEVIRVVKKMPKWKPGKNHDQSVSVYFSLPVKFTSVL